MSEVTRAKIKNYKPNPESVELQVKLSVHNPRNPTYKYDDCVLCGTSTDDASLCLGLLLARAARAEQHAGLPICQLRAPIIFIITIYLEVLPAPTFNAKRDGSSWPFKWTTWHHYQIQRTT
jgi:hypothetical protein